MAQVCLCFVSLIDSGLFKSKPCNYNTLPYDSLLFPLLARILKNGITLSILSFIEDCSKRDKDGFRILKIPGLHYDETAARADFRAQRAEEQEVSSGGRFKNSQDHHGFG